MRTRVVSWNEAALMNDSVVRLDFVMPKMNGYQVCRALAEDDDLRDVPVVLMSAKGDQVGERLGVGIRRERHPRGHQPGPELARVLDDAVVDHRQRTGAVGVRVGVAVGRRTVRDPVEGPLLVLRGGCQGQARDEQDAACDCDE